MREASDTGLTRAARADPVDLHPAHGRRDAIRRRQRARDRRPARDGRPCRARRRSRGRVLRDRLRAGRPRARPAGRRRAALHLLPQGRGYREACAHDSASRPEPRGNPMDTVLRSRSKTVTIGAGQPFCIIGERINPTGRKTFAEELRGGDLSTVTADALAQVAAGADMLDVNAGIPLVDEPELLKAMLQRRPGRRRRADLHRLLRDRGARGRAVGVRGPRARQLGHRRGRAAGGDPAAGRHATARP